MIANRPGVDGARERVLELLQPAVTRSQYESGTTDTSLVGPDGWAIDQHFLDLEDRREAQVALALDYHSNVEHYPRWQQRLRDHRPPALIVWARGDPFFLEEGAMAYLHDLPDAQLHVLDTGHFALEECLPEIGPAIARSSTGTGTANPPGEGGGSNHRVGWPQKW